MNVYDLEPAQQKKWALERLFRYIRRYIYPYHPYLRRAYKQAGVNVDRLRTEDDLRRLPIVDKKAMRADPQAFILRPAFPGVPPLADYETAPPRRSMLAKYIAQAALNLPREYTHQLRQPDFREKVRRRALMEWLPIHFHVSTGSTGAPTPATYTHYDLNNVIKHVGSTLLLPKRALRDPNECYYDWTERGMNMFPGAPHLAFFSPVLSKTAVGTSTFDTFGGSVIPTDRTISLFEQGGFSAMTAVPSYFVHWLRRAITLQQEGAIGKLSAFKRVVLGAEPVSDTLREHIRELALQLGADPRFRIFQSLGMTEMKWFGLECSERSGIHMNSRYFYWELLHPETREPVAEGEPGVLVFSHIDWRGTALVRYWTGDLVKGGMQWQRCPHCGWTFPRVFTPICRAEKDFTKIKGTRVDLSVLIEAVRDTPGVRNFQVSLESEDAALEYSRDLLVLHVLPQPGHDTVQLEENLQKRMKYFTEVSADRVIFEADEPSFEKKLFARTGIKAEYVVERRKEHI